MSDQSGYVEYDITYLCTLANGFSPSDDGATSYFISFEGVGSSVTGSALYTSYAAYVETAAVQTISATADRHQVVTFDNEIDPDGIMLVDDTYSTFIPDAGTYKFSFKTSAYNAGVFGFRLVKTKGNVEIDSIDGSGTYTTASDQSANISIGDVITVKGCGNAGNNGNKRVTGVSGTAITVAEATIAENPSSGMMYYYETVAVSRQYKVSTVTYADSLDIVFESRFTADGSDEYMVQVISSQTGFYIGGYISKNSNQESPTFSSSVELWKEN